MKEEDYEKAKEVDRNQKALSRRKRKEADPQKLREEENARQEKHRRVESANDRLKEFREVTMYNAIFICTCCHQRMFQSNVCILTDILEQNINNKKPEHIAACIERRIPTRINGDKHCYICKTCLRHMQNKKMPPMSTMNCLQLKETDKQIHEQNLQLTELEGALIAKNIIFQKIYQLPKSRWTALTDRVVNVPINEHSIINTLEKMPRTPRDAGLIGVALKRKIEYKNTHKHQLINPDKLFRMLDKLKRSKNPHYKFYDEYDVYETRCRRTDPSGYDTVFNDDTDDLQEIIDKMDETQAREVVDEIVTDEIEANTRDNEDDESNAEKEEIEFITKDPVKKYQIKYNESLCMTDKYPEISVNNTESSVSLAPGEGQIPKDIMSDEDWDIKAFPHLHNPDGSNGKDQERVVRLTEQNYFINRICNLEKRFSKSSAYLYAAVGYIEKKQINRNINLAGTRGKQVVGKDGSRTYELEDAYRVLENIKNTPSYWKQAKYEMLAKLDNLGAFQLFFTLSCADMRWDENFAAIILERGWEMKYKLKKDGAGNWITEVKARKNDCDWKPIKIFIKEDVDESLHELVRGNVLTATRYYQHRLLAFINKVVMGKNNPMSVKYYTYKIEFQDRGAGHAHGTLWLNLDKIETLIKNQDGTLRSKTDNDDKEKKGPFQGLKRAFKKFRDNEILDETDINSIRRFIDEFTTVSIHENTVGKDVAEIAQEVNKHHHTKTCRKHDTTCRFKYPRFPAPYTIIVQPVQAESSEKGQELLIKYRQILRKVTQVLENKDVMAEIMNRYNKQKETIEEYEINTKLRIKEMLKIAGVDYNEYIQALGTSKTGYSIIQRRDLDEIYINPYNIEWLRAWNGNMDIQIVLDYFAVITYVTDYYAKDDTGTMEIIRAVLEDTSSKDLREKMKMISNVFLTHRQMGEAEAVYRLLPSMKLKKSNVGCQWLSLGRKEERSSRWKKATQKEVESGRHVTELLNHDGFWYEYQDMWSKYLRRPVELEDMCCAQFAKMYRSGGSAKNDEDDCGMHDEDDGESNTEDLLVDNEEKFHYIMTYKNNFKKETKLPMTITLKDPYPNEPSMMKKRGFPAVLRFNKSNKDNDPKKYMLSELMLYRPTREEIDPDQVEEMYQETYDGRRKVDIVKSQVMEHLEGVEEARYYVEQVQKELDMTEIANRLDPALEQANADCDEEVIVEHPDFLHIDPGLVNTEEINKSSGIYKRIDIPNADDLKENTRSLDKYQREVVNIGIKYAKDIVKARKENNSSPTAPLLMVHGGAGAGK